MSTNAHSLQSKKEIKTRMLEVNEDPRKRLKEIQQKEEDKLKTRHAFSVVRGLGSLRWHNNAYLLAARGLG
jgi:hypothetical protein